MHADSHPHLHLRPVSQCERRDERYLVTARASDPVGGRLHLGLIDGSRAFEQIRTARVENEPGRPEKTFATLALRSRKGGVDRKPIDVSWLKAASETYHISPDPRDFVFVSVPIVTADVPNRNMDCFSFAELSNFSPIHGRLTYQTFIGKATHQNHKNQDPTKAKGAHFDATFRQYMVRPGHVGYNSGAEAIPLWKVRVLLGFDRTKDAALVRSILRRERTAYSMGALVDYATCSLPFCKRLTTPRPCEHVAAGKGKVIQGYVVYDYVRGCNFIETSILDEEPADPDAWENEAVWSVGREAA